MSGTTAKTSFSQEEIGELDPDVMVDVLPSLSSAADELTKLLVPADPKARPIVRKEIRTANSKHNKLYNNRVSSLNVHKHSFGSTEYIQPSIILRAMFGVASLKDVPTGPWRPDAVIYEINIAQMLRCVLITLFDNMEMTVEGYNAIEALDVNFPTAIAGPDFNPQAFELCLSILTQLAIVRVAVFMTDPNFVARDTIANTFYTPDEDGDQVFRHRNVMHMMTLSPEDSAAYTDVIAQLTNQLIDAFDNTAPVTALGALRARYPWDEFLEYVVQYSLERKQELDQQIAACGGSDQIMLGLSEEVERRANTREAEFKRQSFARPGGTPQKSFGKGGIRALKAREKQLAASTAPTAPVAQMIEPNFVHQDNTAPPLDGGFNRAEGDGMILQPSQAQSTARSTLQALSNLQNGQRQNAAKAKGRSFIDRQEGAQRVAFDESQPTQYAAPPEFQYPTSSAPAQGPYYQSPRVAKRPYQEIEEEEDGFDPTQDQGFQADMRDTTAADQRRREAPQSRAPPQPRFSTVAGGVPGPSGQAPSGMTPSPIKRQRKNPGSTIPAPPAPFDPEDEREIPREDRMQRARVAARHGTIMASQQRPVQVRKPWTGDEENALINLIEEEGKEGISYAKLKAFDDSKGAEALLARRSAEDIRFKARNMKETFLK